MLVFSPYGDWGNLSHLFYKIFFIIYMQKTLDIQINTYYDMFRWRLKGDRYDRDSSNAITEVHIAKERCS